MKTNQKNQNGYVNLLKFLMSIIIMWGHYQYVFSDEFKGLIIDLKLLELFHNHLDLIVCAFFVISGYYCYLSYFKKLDSGEKICSNFILERAKRLIPMMFLSIIYFMVVDLLFVLFRGHFWANRNVDLAHAILQAMGIGRWTAITNHVNGPLWYVSVLLFCYCIFSVIASLKCDKLAKMGLYFGVLVVGIILEYQDVTRVFFSVKMGRAWMCFFAGILFAYLNEQSDFVGSMTCIVVSFLIFMLFMAVKRISGIDVVGNTTIVYTALVIPSLIFLGEKRWMQAIFNNCVTDWLGKVSFPVYLFHIPTFALITFVFGRITYGSWKVVFAITIAVVVISAGVLKIDEWMNRKPRPSRES